jgi:hypothetical protein
MTLDLILSLMDSLLKLALLQAQSVSPEQRADFWARHETRLRRLDRFLEQFDPLAVGTDKVAPSKPLTAAQMDTPLSER